jgi:hypothetical protein
MRLASMYRSILFAMALVPLTGMGEEPLPIESIASGYFNAGSYCDAGKRGWRPEPGQPYTEETFERCARRDGRFKYVEKLRDDVNVVNWSDAKQYYRYLPYGRRYLELQFDDPVLYDIYRDRSQIYPVFVFEMFSAEPRRITSETERATYLRSFAVNEARSTPQHSVLERNEELFNSAKVRIVWRERLWLLNTDRSIVRFERLKNDDVLRYVEISSREVGRSLTDADLWYDAPLFARFFRVEQPGGAYCWASRRSRRARCALLGMAVRPGGHDRARSAHAQQLLAPRAMVVGRNRDRPRSPRRAGSGRRSLARCRLCVGRGDLVRCCVWYDCLFSSRQLSFGSSVESHTQWDVPWQLTSRSTRTRATIARAA